MDPDSSYGRDAVETEVDPSGTALPAAAVAQEMDQFDFYQGGNVGEGANAESSAAAAQSTLEFGLGNSDFLLDTVDVMEAMDSAFQIWSDKESYLSKQDALVSSIPCGNHVAGDVEAIQPGSGPTEEHNLINYKSSQGASCSTLPQSIGDRDQIQTSDANIERERDDLESDPRVPREGIEFDSELEVYDFYNKYAKQTGFKMRRGKTEYLGSNKAVIKGKYFLCSSKERIDKPTQDTRRACEAKIKCTVKDGKWKISKVILEHNHDLERCLAGSCGGAEDSPATTALSTGKNVDEVRTVGERALISNVDRSDVLRDTGKNHSKPQDLIDHFKNMQIEDPSFFYTAQVEAAHGMANFFWRDGRSMVDYEHFGDVLVLDTRTRINNMICAAFYGLNHHRQRIIFGCAFLVNRTVATFNWLLQSFLEAMRWQKPQTILTEVNEEIAKALRVVLPETSHCLPFWSILNSDQSGVGKLFSECVFHVHSREEFESKWNALVTKYGLHENAWVTSLYGMREKWCHAFTKNVFSAGLLSIQNDEDARAVFGNISCETMTLSQIAHRCGKVAEHMCRKEFLEDKRCEKNTANLTSRSPVEKEAECLYTRPIFRMFQEELINGLSLAIQESTGTATLRIFKLTEQGSTNVGTIKFDPANSTLACSCGKFESMGILCFHALKVLNFMNIFEIPSRYLLKRWMKSAKDSLPVDTPSAGTAPDRGTVDSFVGEFMRKALHVAHRCGTKKRERIALRSIDLALENIAKASRTEEMDGDSEGMDDMGPD